MNTDSILIVDDDETFTQVLARALTKRGHTVLQAQNSEQAMQQASMNKLNKVVLDLKINQESGLTLIPKLLTLQAELSILILTGYSSIATAVEAIKLGAVNYLCKPADADQILNAFVAQADPQIALAETMPSVNRLTWEHIQKTLSEHDGNISATARSLGMHRRTLQRKLQKRPVKQ